MSEWKSFKKEISSESSTKNEQRYLLRGDTKGGQRSSEGSICGRKDGGNQSRVIQHRYKTGGLKSSVQKAESGVAFEVIDADPRRIKRLRLRLPGAQAAPAALPPPAKD